MSELDDVLRQSFARIAEPGDPAGVADALRARMAAGDTGTPAATSGFRSTADRVLPWLFGGALLGILAVILTLTGLAVSAPTPTLTAADTAQTMAAPTETVPTVTTTPTSTPTETATPAETAAPAPAPAPAADSAAPTLSGAAASPSQDLCADDSYSSYYAIASTISVTAADNVGIIGVHITWTGAESGSAEMSFGSPWTYTFNPASSTPSGTVTFTLVARDAAGNTSAPATTSVTVIDGGGCII